MSIKAMTWVFEQQQIGGTDKLIMLALADHADESGFCYPAMDRIAIKATVSKRTAQRVVLKLEKKGWLHVKRGTGKGNPNKFWLNYAKGDNLTPLEKQRVTPMTPKGDIAVTPKGDIAVSPEPSITINNHQYMCDFEKFWNEYPHRKGSQNKAAAQKKFIALRKQGVSQTDLLSGARKYYEHCSETEQVSTPFVCMASTWLNQGRWEDEF